MTQFEQCPSQPQLAPQPAASLLKVHDLQVHYRRRGSQSILKASDQVSLDVFPGETVGVVGESGSGKSTVAKAALGLAPVHAGTIQLAGRDITHLGPRGRRDLSKIMQVVFQDPNASFNPYLTVGRSLAEPLEVHGLRPGPELRQRVAQALERVGLPPEAAERFLSQFSGGQKQRLAIARALIVDPQLVICDEAVSALDLSIQAQILNLLVEQQRGRQLSYLFISHDIEVVRYISDRIYVLYLGQVMETGPAAAVTGSPAHPYTRELLDSAPVADPRIQRRRNAEETQRKAERPEGIASAVVSSPQGCPFAPRCLYASDLCRAERPPLRLTGQGSLVACHHYPDWQINYNQNQGTSA